LRCCQKLVIPHHSFSKVDDISPSGSAAKTAVAGRFCIFSKGAAQRNLLARTLVAVLRTFITKPKTQIYRRLGG
jgi:hypothetical protein